MTMTRPTRFGVEDVTAAEVAEWAAEHGEYWPDEVEPETCTRVWNFDTREAALAFARGPVPSGYCLSVFERRSLVRDEHGLWDWQVVEIPWEEVFPEGVGASSPA